MKHIKQLIVIGSIVLAVLFLLYFFVFEGFAPSTVDEGRQMNAGDALQATCAANSTCSSCVATPNCGWASDYSSPVSGLAGVPDGKVLACIPKAGVNPYITTNLGLLMIKLNGARVTLNKFITDIGDCTDITCSSKITCRTCVTFKKCTWQQVQGADGATGSQTCMDTTAAGEGDTTRNNIKEVTKCPVPQCSELTDCQDCTNTTGCGYCASSGKCLKVSEFGPGANQCSTDNKVVLPASCPCSGITDCATCAGRVGCAFCKGIKKFVNVDRNGKLPENTCVVDDAATSESQCSADTITRLPGALDAGTDDKPTGAQIDAAASGGILDQATPPTGGVGDQQVSPAPSYTYNTAPGVARKAGASSVPASAANSTGVDDAPLESYVKMLVNSQLAAQGIPTNEPFTVREQEAIPNATDYMKKVFRGVFN